MENILYPSQIYKIIIKELKIEFLQKFESSKNVLYEFTYPLKEEDYYDFKDRVEKNLPVYVIHFPKENIIDSLKMSFQANKYSFIFISTIVKFVLNVNSNIELAKGYCVYSLLHEIGHFHHFMSFSSIDTYFQFIKEHSEFLKMNSQNRMKNNITDNEQMQYELKYITSAGEFEANLYALEHMKQIYSIL